MDTEGIIMYEVECQTCGGRYGAEDYEEAGDTDFCPVCNGYGEVMVQEPDDTERCHACHGTGAAAGEE